MKKLVLFLVCTFIFNYLHTQNRSLHFDGVDDVVVGPSSALLEISNGTVELWIKPETKATKQTFLCYRDNTGFQTRYLWNLTENLSGLGFWNGNGYAIFNYSFSSGQWYHLAFVGGNSHTLIYINGINIGAFGSPFGPATGNNLQLILGQDIPGSEYFKGELDEIQLWNKCLTPEEIRKYMLCKPHAGSPGLVAYYDFDQGIAGGQNSEINYLLDKTPNTLDAGLYNFALNGNSSNWISASNEVNAICDTVNLIEHFISNSNDSLEKINSNITSDAFCVATDGSNSIFKALPDSNNSCTNFNLRIKLDGVSPVEEFGKFIKIGIDTGVSIFKYTHPSCPPINNDGTDVTFLIMELVDECADSVMESFKINLVPTIPVYIHGINSSAAAMSLMKYKISTELSHFKKIDWLVDYSGTHNDSFATNSYVVPSAITSVLNLAKINGCAASKVDIVGHSMGGILARKYIQNNNIYANNVRKLITLNTPHYGSHLADILWNYPGINTLTNVVFPDKNNGAVVDLRTNSVALSQLNNAIPSRDIRTHGIYSSLEIALNVGVLGLVSSSVLPGLLLLALGNSISDTDGVVAVTSQKGGIPSNALTGFENIFHTHIEGTDLVIEEVKQLLLECPSSNKFSSYGYQAPGLQSKDQLATRSSLTPTINITTSRPTDNLYIDDTLTIYVSGLDITSNILYFNLPGDSVYAAYNNGTIGQYPFKVPKSLVGTHTVYAIGINSVSQEIILDSVIFDVSCTSAFTGEGTIIFTKAILGGAYGATGDTMSTTLYSMGLIPLKCPYDTTVMQNSLPVNMVDWVKIELVDTLTGDTSYASLCACLHKDGSIQNICGDSTLTFPGVTNPYVSLRIKHRNHLSTRSNSLNNTPGIPIPFDFRLGTNLFIDPTITGNIFHNVGLPELLIPSGGAHPSRYALWPGDGNADGQVKYQGSSNDRAIILSTIGGSVITNTTSGYLPSDISLNGQVKYQGSGNDRALILSSIGGTNITKISKAHN